MKLIKITKRELESKTLKELEQLKNKAKKEYKVFTDKTYELLKIELLKKGNVI